VAQIEAQIDALTARCGASDYFILPGGTPAAAALHQARVTARRAERRLWTLHRQDPLPEDVLPYVNRLSDLFFVMARAEMMRQSADEERWKLFAYKRK
jgi:ATP:cob(I)alamin adenosyltransferase